MKKFRKIVIVAFVLIGIIAYGVSVKAINSDLKLSSDPCLTLKSLLQSEK